MIVGLSMAGLAGIVVVVYFVIVVVVILWHADHMYADVLVSTM